MYLASTVFIIEVYGQFNFINDTRGLTPLPYFDGAYFDEILD